MRKTLVSAGILTAFLLAGLAPIAMADDPEPEDASTKEERRAERDAAKEERKTLKEEDKQAKEDRKEQREKHAFRYAKGNVSLDLSGTALGKDNATYTFNLTAEGQGVERIKVHRDGNETRFRYHARLMAHVVVYDANGTVVKEGDIRVHLFARGHGDDVKWILGSIGKRDDGMPRLVLKGEVEQVSPGLFELDGKGKMVFRMDDAPRAIPLRVTEVSGTFSREVPAAPPAA